MENDPDIWWQCGVIYQIYPRSYQDSNGDGIGDINGIIGRLDYLHWLGINAIWISPIYPSPMADFGYDISNYTDIHPLFGTMEDFDRLLALTHEKGMKLILDFVPNHSSSQHPWFLESRSSTNNPKRDWYIWKDARADGRPPNNWLSVFGGSGWEWDEATNQYYYHAFLKEQPDLNWRNPEVQQAMLDAMKFWLDRGVDGFRVDVMWHMIKDGQFRDNPVNPGYQPHMATYEQLLPVYSTDQPEVHDIVQMMRALLDKYDNRMMIGEIYLPIHKLVSYYGTNNNGAHLPFNFLLLSIQWSAAAISAAIDEYEGALPASGWPNWVLGNHDQPRITSRVGLEQARVAAIMLLTLRGTPTVYYGDEIGMQDVAIPALEVQDPQGLNMPGKNLSRDPSRTPMQWDNRTNAGFTSGKPWLRLNKSFVRNNVSLQKHDAYSMLHLYKQLIDLRRKEPALISGQYRAVTGDMKILAYTREGSNGKRFLIVLNLTHGPAYFQPAYGEYRGHVILSASSELEGVYVNGSIELNGDEGIIVELE